MPQQLKRRVMTAARTSLPAATAPVLARVGTHRAVKDPVALADARAQMELLLGATGRTVDDDLARRYLAQVRWRREALWHPERWWPAVPVVGVEHLAGVRDGGCLSFLHHGVYNQIGASLREVGVAVTGMLHPNLLRPDAEAWERNVVRATRSEVFSAAEGAAGVSRRMRAGALVAVANDVAGPVPLTFLGRPVAASFGGVKVAFEAGLPVVVVRSHTDPAGSAYLSVAEPLRPQDHGSALELLTRVLALHEEAVLAWPEAYDDPAAKCFPAAGAS